MGIILGLIVLALDIWAVLNVWNSGASSGEKLLWTIGIVIFPVIGFIVWYLAGPGTRKALA